VRLPDVHHARFGLVKREPDELRIALQLAPRPSAPFRILVLYPQVIMCAAQIQAVRTLVHREVHHEQHDLAQHVAERVADGCPALAHAASGSRASGRR